MAAPLTPPPPPSARKAKVAATRSAARSRSDSARSRSVVLGHQVRDLRRAKRLTLVELAERIDRSVGWLSQIERGISEVSIAALQPIAEALGVQLSWFFAEAAPPQPDELGVVLRKAARRQIDFHGSKVHEEILSPSLSGQLLLVESTFAPGATTGDRDRVRRGEEAGVVLRGELELVVDGKTLRLGPGDSFAFTRSGPHRCRNPGKTPTVVIWVITPPSY